MSTTIDQRVVEMQFDNRQFESNVQTTMSTLDRLKQSLNLTGASKGLDSVNNAARNNNLGMLGSAAETVGLKFNAMYTIADQTLRNITNSVERTAKRMVDALTIDPIKTGFAEYETQINAVQTILANTKSKGTDIKDVNKALDTLNTYADKTIYNFTEMTRNIGTFTAAGVDLDTSVKSIQGIANLAAVSGSSSQQASTAMYQLSQALASGKVNLQDWNSVVNAGMGGEVFQNALKRTAKVMGTDVDALIKKYGSFRESLSKGEWLTTDVLTKTLEQFTMSAEKGSKEWEKFKKSLMAEGYTEKQAEEILDMANTATDAATKVKTFTQLWDTLKEAAQSGWTQTWEIIVGDFEEAKSLLTNVSDVIGKMIGDSANARNELLQGWKDAGGRNDLVEGIKNAFNGLMAIITPVKEAFRDIFPPLTVDQLVKFTEGFKNLTKKFETFADGHGDQIYSIFKGIFSVLDIGVTVIKEIGSGIADVIGHFTGFSGGVLGIAASIGDWLSNIRDSIKETGVLSNAVEKITGFLGKAIDKFKEFTSSVKLGFQNPGYEGFVGILKVIWDLIKSIGKAVSNIFSNVDFSGGFDVINSGLFTGVLIGINKFINGLSDPFEGVSDLFENITGVLDDVRGCMEAYQNNLKANMLLKISGAIALLAAAILVISSIDSATLSKSLGAITILFTELMASLYVFTTFGNNIKGAMKASVLMIGMSTAILILAAALKKISSIDSDGITRGLIAIGVLMAEISIFLRTYKFDSKLTGVAVGIVILSSAMLILAKAVKNFGGMSLGELGKGLTSIGILLTELSLFTRFTGDAKHVISTGIAMTLLASSMKIFASVIKDFGGMSWGEIGKGLVAMGGALAELAIAMNVMPKNMVSMGVGMIAVGAAMKIMADALRDFGGMTWEEIGRGLTAMGGALAELAIALMLMRGSLAGSAALLIAAGALAIITPVLNSLGNMTWGEIAKGLVALAGAFAVIGLAGMLLTPVIPSILGLAGAFALIGLAAVGLGVGLNLIAAGFTALAVAGAAGATSFVAALTVMVTGIIGLIPEIVRGLGEGILAFCEVIIQCVPTIAKTIAVVISEVLATLATYTPQIVDSLFTFVIGILKTLADRLPELIQVAVEVIAAFFQGVVDALRGIDSSSLIKGIVGVGLLTGLMYALSFVVGLIPGAMAGVLGMGIVIAELALVLAAIGGLAQIPGLSWLIEEGGDLLQKIGTALGQFVGGLVGGVAKGVTSALPQIGSDLSAFMTNAKPFIDGAKTVDASLMEGVKSLASAMLILTGANLLEQLTSWFTGGSSLVTFGQELATFGPYMKQYSDSVAGINVEAVRASADALKVLADAGNSIDGQSEWGKKLFGDNSIATFADKLPSVGTSLSDFAENLGTFSDDKVKSIKCAANAIKVMADAGSSIDGQSEWGKKLFGDNGIAAFSKDLPKVATNLKDFAKNLGTFGEEKVTTVNTVVKVIKSLAKLGEVDLASASANLPLFGSNMVGFADDLKSFCEKMEGVEDKSISTTMSNIVKSISETVDKISDKTEDFKSAGSGLIKALKSGIKDKKESIEEASTSIATAAKKAITEEKDKFKSAGKTLMKSLKTAITEYEDTLKKAVEKVVGNAADAISDYSDDFESAGKDLGNGLVAGIEAKYDAAYDAGYELGQMAVQGEKDGQKSNSPSKLTIQAGHWLGEGLVIGIKEMGRKVYNAGHDMGNSASKSMSAAITRVSDILSTDIDTQPTIRPVLDLSDVSSGTSAINSMLNMGSSIGVSANVGSISRMMNNRIQNGGNSEVVSAINRLRKDLGNVGGTSYNINGITYDDGTNVSDAVKTLVRAAKIERRV